MDSFLKNKLSSFVDDAVDQPPKAEQPPAAEEHHPVEDKKPPAADAGRKDDLPSNSELFSSAKLVAEAAKLTLSSESDKVDKARAADAAGDLLGAGSHYGKLEESGYGKYVDQAEDYLHKYGSSTTTTTTGSGQTTTITKDETKIVTNPSGKEDEKSSGGGYGDVFKMAQGFLSK